MSAPYWWAPRACLLSAKATDQDSPFVDAREYEIAVERGDREEAAAKYERLRVEELERRAGIGTVMLRHAAAILNEHADKADAEGVARGLADVAAGRTRPLSEVRRDLADKAGDAGTVAQEAIGLAAHAPAASTPAPVQPWTREELAEAIAAAIAKRLKDGGPNWSSQERAQIAADVALSRQLDAGKGE